MIKHYIENKKIIPTILEFGWMVRNNTWTDCPLDVQETLKIWHESAYGE